jgi:hypothetical protein
VRYYRVSIPSLRMPHGGLSRAVNVHSWSQARIDLGGFQQKEDPTPKSNFGERFEV